MKLNYLPARCVQVLILASGLLLEGTTAATPVVTGTVSLDTATGIYTYSYTLDNTGAPGNVTQFYLQVNSIGSANFYPLSFTSPTDWPFSVNYAAGGSCPEYGECGGFWAWMTPNPAPNGLPPGQSLSGFSFRTKIAPSTSTANDYFLFYPYNPDYAVFGNVIAPDYLLSPPPPTPAPEAATTSMFVIGLISSVGFKAIGRLRRVGRN